VELQNLHSAKANKESTLRQSSQQQITVRYSTRQSTIHATVPMANFSKVAATFGKSKCNDQKKTTSCPDSKHLLFTKANM